MMTDNSDVPNPLTGFGPKQIAKIFCDAPHLDKIDGDISAWAAKGGQPIDLFRLWTHSFPNEKYIYQKQKRIKQHADFPLWETADRHAQEAHENLYEIFKGGGLEVWAFSIPRQQIARHAIKISNENELDAWRLNMERVLSKVSYTASRVNIARLKPRSFWSLYAANGRLGRPAKSKRWRGRLIVVRFYPSIALPNFSRRLAGMTLQDAFKKFVLRDPIVDVALKRANHECGAPERVGLGYFTPLERLWPVDFRAAELAEQWIRDGDPTWWDNTSNRIRTEQAPYTPPPILDAANLIRLRLDQFLSPLGKGQVIAVGRLNGRPEQANIAASVWSAQSTRIDFIDGTIQRASETRLRDLAETLQVTLEREWVDISFRPLPEATEEERSTPAKQTKGVKGRPRKFERDRVLGIAIAWIYEGSKDQPKTQKHFVDILLAAIEHDGFKGEMDESTVKIWLREHQKPLLAAFGLTGKK